MWPTLIFNQRSGVGLKLTWPTLIRQRGLAPSLTDACQSHEQIDHLFRCLPSRKKVAILQTGGTVYIIICLLYTIDKLMQEIATGMTY
jgi:hypothetical protein